MKSSKDTEIKQTIEINMGIEESENENDNDTDPDQDPDVGTVERKATIKRNKNLLSNNSTLEDWVNFLGKRINKVKKIIPGMSKANTLNPRCIFTPPNKTRSVKRPTTQGAEVAHFQSPLRWNEKICSR